MRRSVAALITALVVCLTHTSLAAVNTNGLVCNSNGWRGLDPARWDELARPSDGESYGCDYPNLPLECALGQECDHLWYSQCELYTMYVTKPIDIAYWTATGPDRTYYDTELLTAHYYPCTYFCVGWFWVSTKCKQLCPDGELCCLTTCNNIGNIIGDGDGDGDVDLADYAVYQRLFGQQATFSRSASASSPVFGSTDREKALLELMGVRRTIPAHSCPADQ